MFEKSKFKPLGDYEVRKMGDFTNTTVELLPLSTNELFIKKTLFVIGAASNSNTFFCSDEALAIKIIGHLLKNKSRYVNYSKRYYCIVEMNKDERYISFFGRRIFDTIIEETKGGKFNINCDRLFLHVKNKKVGVNSFEYDDYSDTVASIKKGYTLREKYTLPITTGKDVTGNLDFLLSFNNPEVNDIVSIIREHKVNKIIE